MIPYVLAIFEDEAETMLIASSIVSAFDPEAKTVDAKPFSNSADYESLQCTGTVETAKAHYEAVRALIDPDHDLRFLFFVIEEDVEECEEEDCESECGMYHDGDELDVDMQLKTFEEFLEENELATE